MLALSFKNRIAFFNLLSSSTIVFAVFVVIYLVVSTSVIFDINRDLDLEVTRHLEDVERLKDTSHLVRPGEWQESEHTEININPVFVQILDRNGRFMEKSPNLKNENLVFFPNEKHREFHDTKIGDVDVRQVQTPLFNNGIKVGYAIIAMSIEEPMLVVDNLRFVLFVTFPIVLIVLFFSTRSIAGKSIEPVQGIIDTASSITNNLQERRINLPPHKDELYTLSSTINNLLDRIENAIQREKQFTSDASHELRTPLAVIKGTLEVLIRKPRETEEYEEKIKYCIGEVNRLSNLVDQLLLLARFENQKFVANAQDIALDELILESLERFSSKIENNQMTIDFSFEKHYYVVSDSYLVSIIIENLLSNALKYSSPDNVVRIELTDDANEVACRFTDYGIGINKADIENIYDRFYRSGATEHPRIKGTGLGLSLVRRICELLQLKLNIESVEGHGTTATLIFPKSVLQFEKHHLAFQPFDEHIHHALVQVRRIPDVFVVFGDGKHPDYDSL